MEAFVFFMMFTGMPILLATGGLALLWQTHRFMGRAFRTTGRVIEQGKKIKKLHPEIQGGGRRQVPVYAPLFEYTDLDGTVQRGRTYDSSTSHDFELDAEVDILVDPTSGEVRIPGLMVYGFGAIFLAAGLGLGLLGLFVSP